MITLAEMAKRADNPLEKGVIQLYQEHSDILNGIPFIDIKGNAYSKRRELTLSGVGTRAVNTDYSDSTGTQERISEDLKIMGGTAKIDRFIIKTENDSDVVADEIQSKVKASAMYFNKLFVKGNATTDTNAFDGLENRLTSDNGQILYAGDTAGGDALTLAKLDELIDMVGSPSHLIMNAKLRRSLNQLMRASGQAFEYIDNGFGRLIPYYAGIPIAITGVDNTFSEIMPFNEADSAGDDALCSSIYAVRYGTDGVLGIQNSAPIVEDQGMVGNSRVIVVDWYTSYLINQPKAAARLAGIKA